MDHGSRVVVALLRLGQGNICLVSDLNSLCMLFHRHLSVVHFSVVLLGYSPAFFASKDSFIGNPHSSRISREQ